MKKAIFAWTAGFLVAVAAAGVSAQSQASPQAQAPTPSLILEKIIVKVNGEILTQGQLEQMQIADIRERSEGKPMSNAEVQKAMAELTPQILVTEIDNLLVVQHGRELGIKFTDERFKQSLEAVKKQNNIKDDAQLAAELKAVGMTIEQLRENFERTFIQQQAEQREIGKNMTLTEQEARQYYKEHPAEFTKPPTVTIREILAAVPTENVGGQASFTVAADEAAKEKIAAIRERAVKGEDFAKLAGELSDASTKANGGLLPPVVIGELNPVLDAAIVKLKPGEISEPVRLRAGHQIFKLESRSTPEPEPFENVRNEIAQKIYESRLDVERAKLVEKLRKQALIEWKDDTYRKMYETAAAARAKGGN